MEIGINRNSVDDPEFGPADGAHGVTHYYPAHDANFNITALFNTSGEYEAAIYSYQKLRR